ncbi:MAG: class I SAM-dependent methyltransferase [bacterium]|nr:class I SAM-dependent methyltransferase [bacterium]
MTAGTISARVRLGEEGFAQLLGVDPSTLPPACGAALAVADLRYEVLCDRERDAQLLTALRGSEAEDLRPSGPHRAADWERGWSENLRELDRAASHDVLIPKYNKYDVLRLMGDYVRVRDRRFEYAVYTALRHWCFERWFRDCSAVTEFGCGTGTSLLQLAETMPHLELTGCDWAPSSQAILERLSARCDRRIEPIRFDMFHPDTSVTLGAGVGVLTSAAMEQLGHDHVAFLDYLVAQRPQVAVHIEPIYELYDDSVLFDEVARRYHRHRNYLSGFLPRLRQLAQAGVIELLAERRTGFGSFFHEGYSVVVWRPASGPTSGAPA